MIARIIQFIAAGLACLAISIAASAEEPLNDKLTVHGDTLRGRVVNLSATSVEFRTAYGDGNIHVSYEDVEALETEGYYKIFFGEGEEATGRLLGVRDSRVIVSEDTDSTVDVPVESIRGVTLRERYEESLLTRLRTRHPYWNVELDLSVEFEDGAVEKVKPRSRLRLERRLDPTRFSLEVEYALDVQKKRDGPRVTTKDELVSLAFYQHDLPIDRLFAHGQMGYEFDTPRNINGRVFPGAALGYRILERGKDFVSVGGGFGWVWEAFDGSPNRDYAAALIGLEGNWLLPRGMRFRSHAMYMPSLDDFGSHWLYRWGLELTMPIWDPIAMRFRVTGINDDNPTTDVGNNKVTTILGLALSF